jgi:single-strand DNA-binding protein
MNVNKVIWVARIASDVTTKMIGNANPVALVEINVVTSESRKKKDGTGYEDIPTFMTAKIWGKTAEYVGKHASKGDLVYIEGSIDVEKYDTQSGETRYKTVIKVSSYGHEVKILRKKGDGGSSEQSQSAPQTQQQARNSGPYNGPDSFSGGASTRQQPQNTASNGRDDDDLPF